MHIVADIIERGFPLSQTAHTYLLDAGDPIFGQDPISRAALFDEDVLRRQGEKVAFVDLAPTLRLLGDDGVETLYGGSLGEAIADDLRARGGRLTREDFSSYQAIARQPLTATMDDWRVLTNPPPAVGGVALMTAMAVLANSRHPLDPAVWMKSLTEAFTVRSKELELAEDREAAADQILKRAGLRSPSTIAVAAVDDSGSAVTASFSAGYGSGVVPHGTGMLMNNSVGEIELLPGGIESHTPGQRMLSNMAPSIARSNNKVIALASPGADRITSALTITLARAVLAGDGLVAAINHPRVHPEFTDSGVRAAVEPGLDISGLKGEIRFYDETHMYFGGVAGAALELSSLTAYADPRRVGSAVLIN
jgi:gamma-glutamyltranspeptidase/glutathione hydrolase